MLPKRRYGGPIPIRRRTVPGGTARPTGGKYPGSIVVRQKTPPRGTARPTGGRYPGTITIRPRPTVTIKPRPAITAGPTRTTRTTVLMGGVPVTPKPPGQYPGTIPIVATGPVTGGAILPTANGTGLGAGAGLPAIGGNTLVGLGNIGSSISTGVGGILSVGRSYVPLAIKAVAIIIIIKIALWIFRGRR